MPSWSVEQFLVRNFMGMGIGRQAQHELLRLSVFKLMVAVLMLLLGCNMVKQACHGNAGSSGAASELPGADKQHPLWRPAPDLPHEPPAATHRPLARRPPGHPQAHLRADLPWPRAQARLQEPAEPPRAPRRPGQTVSPPLQLLDNPIACTSATSLMCCSTAHSAAGKEARLACSWQQREMAAFSPGTFCMRICMAHGSG